MERTHIGGWRWREIDRTIANFDAFNHDDTISLDISTRDVNVNQYQTLIIIQGGNATGAYYITSPAFALSSPDGNLVTATMSWKYGPLLTLGPITGWATVRLVANCNAAGAFYYDKLRLPNFVPPEGEQTLLASYEQSEKDANNLKALVVDDGNNTTEVVTWPMLEGTDAYPYDHNFGHVTVPAATDGNRVLGMSWTNEGDGRVDLHHEWATSHFDFTEANELRIDAYIVGPNGVPTNIELWDAVLGWIPGQFLATLDSWFTVSFTLPDANKTADHNQITTIYFSGVDSNDGKVFFDNLRLWKSVDLKATLPNPKNNAEDVQRNSVVLSWKAGAYAAAAHGHKVYFDDVEAKVTARNGCDVNGVSATNPSYGPLAILDPLKTYYWAIDEVNAAHPGDKLWKGNVWSFTTGEYIVVDDFDSYADDDALRDVWIGGGRAQISLQPGANDANLVRDGNSMMYYYDNYFGPYYAEAYANTANLQVGSNWTVGGVKALALWFYGTADNDANEQMYVKLTDGNIPAHSKTVMYDGAMSNIRKEEWQQWNIPLSDFTNVNLANVARITIRFGDGVEPVGQGTGTMYFEDIRLYGPTCRPELAPTDIDGDCFVDYKDLALMANDWLDTDVTLDTNEPNAPYLWYKFNEAAGTAVTDDGTGNHDGTVSNPADNTWDTTGGHDGSGCINLAFGNQTYVVVPPETLNFVTTTHKISVAAWVNGDLANPQDNWNGLFDIRSTIGDDSNNEVVEAHCPTPLAPREPNGPLAQWRVGSYGLLQGPQAPILDFSGRWNHYVFTKDADANVMQIYHNGQLLAESNAPNINGPMFATPVGTFLVGSRNAGWGYYIGRIDDFRVYNYVLSPAEVAYLATDGSGTFPLNTPTNLYDVPPNIVNFKDFAVLANKWLEEELWPQ
jgi:hypothetical protein